MLLYIEGEKHVVDCYGIFDGLLTYVESGQLVMITLPEFWHVLQGGKVIDGSEF